MKRKADVIYSDSGYQSAKQYYEKYKTLDPVIENKDLIWDDKRLAEHLVAILKEYKKKNMEF